MDHCTDCGRRPTTPRRGRRLTRGLRTRVGAALGAALGAFVAMLAVLPAAVHAGLSVRVEIDGVPRDVERSLRAGLTLEEQRGERDLDETRLRQLHAATPAEIAAGLEAFGYYRPNVRPKLVVDANGRWTARYEIEPGPPILLSTVDVRVVGGGEAGGVGLEDEEFRRLAAEFPLRAGERLDHTAYEEGKAALVDYAAGSGYLDAAFEIAEIRIDLETYDAAISLRMNSGPRYRFGDTLLRVRGLDPEILRGYITYEKGDSIDVDNLTELQNGLSNSGYFRQVEVIPRRDLRDLRDGGQAPLVPIEVEMTLAARQRWDLGVGYGTDTGPRGSAELDVRRMNRRGHRGEIDLKISGAERSFASSYQIPGAYPRTDLVSFSVGYSELSLDTSESETTLVGARRARERGEWREALGLTYERADFEVGADQGLSELVVPEAIWSRVDADDRLYPRSGRRMEFGVRGADRSLGSNASFVQVTANWKQVTTLGERLRLIGRAAVGRNWTSDLHELPPRFRFFTGGDQGVRGYEYQSIGPRDEAGEPVGGKTLIEASLEVDALFLRIERFAGLGRFGLAAFYDAGSAADSLGDGLRQGAGVGLRWLSPIGLVRADVAWPIGSRGGLVVDADRGPRFHLAIGPDL